MFLKKIGDKKKSAYRINDSKLNTIIYTYKISNIF